MESSPNPDSGHCEKRADAINVDSYVFASPPEVHVQGRQAMLLDFRNLANEFSGLTLKRIPFDENGLPTIYRHSSGNETVREGVQNERNKHSLTQMMTFIDSGVSSDLGQ
jgi:hypothetical protein